MLWLPEIPEFCPLISGYMYISLVSVSCLDLYSWIELKTLVFYVHLALSSSYSETKVKSSGRAELYVCNNL